MTRLASRIYVYPATSSANLAYQAHDGKLVVLRCPRKNWYDYKNMCSTLTVYQRRRRDKEKAMET